MDTAFQRHPRPVSRHAQWHSQRPPPCREDGSHPPTSHRPHTLIAGTLISETPCSAAPHRGIWRNWHQAPPSSPQLFPQHRAHQPHPLDPHASSPCIQHHSSLDLTSTTPPATLPLAMPNGCARCSTHTHAVGCMRGRESVTASGWHRGVTMPPKHLRHLRQNHKQAQAASRGPPP